MRADEIPTWARRRFAPARRAGAGREMHAQGRSHRPAGPGRPVRVRPRGARVSRHGGRAGVMPDEGGEAGRRHRRADPDCVPQGAGRPADQCLAGEAFGLSRAVERRPCPPRRADRRSGVRALFPHPRHQHAQLLRGGFQPPLVPARGVMPPDRDTPNGRRWRNSSGHPKPSRIASPMPSPTGSAIR